MISLCIDQYRYVFAVRKLVPVRYHFLMICVVVLVPVMEIILDSLLCRAPSSLVYRIYLPYQYISYFVSIPAYSFMIPVPVPVYICPPLSCLSVRWRYWFLFNCISVILSLFRLRWGFRAAGCWCETSKPRLWSQPAESWTWGPPDRFRAAGCWCESS